MRGKKRTELKEEGEIKKESIYTILGLLCIYSRKVVSVLHHFPFAAWVVVVLNMVISALLGLFIKSYHFNLYFCF